MREKRDPAGRIKDSLWQRFKSWRLARKIKKGKLPRGRVRVDDALRAVGRHHDGVMLAGYGFLTARVFRRSGGVEDLGLISVEKITTAFRDALVDSLQGAFANWGNFKYHGCGTGVAGESNSDSALGTEVGSRATGTQIEGATANIYKSVGTCSPGGTYAITEHGLFSAAAAGTLLDRSVFAAINVVDGDSIEFTYQATFNAEA